MLLSAHEQLHHDLIQGYLKGHQSIFKNVTGQLVVFSTIVSLDKQSNRQITEENSSGTILKHVKSVESVLCDKHKFSSYVSN